MTNVVGFIPINSKLKILMNTGQIKNVIFFSGTKTRHFACLNLNMDILETRVFTFCNK